MNEPTFVNELPPQSKPASTRQAFYATMAELANTQPGRWVKSGKTLSKESAITARKALGANYEVSFRLDRESTLNSEYSSPRGWVYIRRVS